MPASFESPLLHMNPSSSAHLLSTSKHTFVNIMFYYSKCNCNRHVSKINTAKPLQNLARHSSLSKKWLLRRIVNSFFFFFTFLSNSLTALTANYKSAKVRKAPVIFQNSKTFVPPYRIEGYEPNRNGMFKVTPLCFFHTEGEKKSPKQKTRTAVVPHNRKAKGSDSAFRDEHAMHLMGTGAGLVT